MKIAKTLFEGLKKNRLLRPVKPIIETLEAVSYTHLRAHET